MFAKTVLALGFAAAIATGAPVTFSSDQEVTVTHTVTIDEDSLPTPTVADDVVGAGVGYGVATSEVETETVTPTVVAGDETAMAGATPFVAASGNVTTDIGCGGAPSVAVPTETPTAISGEATNSTAVEQPVVAVVPVHICTNNGSRCLTTVGSEFADIELSFDQVATFSLGLDGLLVRLDDLYCVDAVPMDDATWYDLAYVNCTLPNYLTGALELAVEGNDTLVDNSTALPEDRTVTLTQAAGTTAQENSTAEAEPATEMHTIWFYNATTSHLCANVHDGLNDIRMVCMYSDEGYAMLGTTEELQNVNRKDQEVTMPVVTRDNTTMGEQLAKMLRAMTYDGSVFWANAWDTNIDTVMKYRMMPHEQDINMGRDEINGVIYPLWQVMNDCRTTCDTYAWCRSFTFHIHERVCTLSSNQPEVKPDELNKKDPDMVTFSQNKNYHREDFVLAEDIKTDIPTSRRRRVVRRF